MCEIFKKKKHSNSFKTYTRAKNDGAGASLFYRLNVVVVVVAVVVLDLLPWPRS